MNAAPTEEHAEDNAAADGRSAAPAWPTWSTVAKRSVRQTPAAGAPVQAKTRRNPRREKKSAVVGTSAGGNIQIVKTKLVSVFATKLMPDLDADTLSNYLKDKHRREVTCIKINTAPSKSWPSVMMSSNYMIPACGRRVLLCGASLSCANPGPLCLL